MMYAVIAIVCAAALVIVMPALIISGRCDDK